MRAKRLRLLGEFAAPERSTAPRAGFCAASGGYLEPAAGPGWIAAGDAAQSYDPCVQGLFNALYTGLAAAEAADRALLGDAGGLPGYAAELRDFRAAYGHHLVAWYGLERRWPHSPFWRASQFGRCGETLAADHLPITPYPYRVAASVY